MTNDRIAQSLVVRDSYRKHLASRETPEQRLAALAEINAHWIGDEIDPATGLEGVYPVNIQKTSGRTR